MRVKNSLFLSIILMLIYSASCANNERTSSDNTDTTALPPVETKTPNSNYRPENQVTWRFMMQTGS